MNQVQKIIKNEGQQSLDKASYRRHNKKWLNYSRKIALRILAAIEDHPKINNQKKLAEVLDISPQQVSKIVKGQENLTLQSIAKFSDILGVELITFPSFKYNQPPSQYIVQNVWVSININSSSYIPSIESNKNWFSDLSSFPFGQNKQQVVVINSPIAK